jgi:DNA-binding MarR family transcriptional regulator
MSPPSFGPESERSPVDPARVRVLPRHFAWVDHRLRDRLAGLTLAEIALLFFLHLVADRTGCSFWAASTIAKKLGLKEGDVIEARYGLISKGLIVYRYPLHQLLPIEDPK